MEPQRDYEKSAAVYQVLGRYKAERDYEFSRKTDFTTEFTEFSHPNIVLADNYSLYTFTDVEAVFVDCGDCDIFDKSKAFVYDTQYQNAIKMVTMPIESFHIVATYFRGYNETVQWHLFNLCQCKDAIVHHQICIDIK